MEAIGEVVAAARVSLEVPSINSKNIDLHSKEPVKRRKCNVRKIPVKIKCREEAMGTVIESILVQG